MPVQTIFVGSLPNSATNERLEEIFSEIGPVKQCFVVREKGGEKCLGFGYVTYSMEEDAQRALKEIKEYDGRKLSLSVALKKRKDKPGADKDTKDIPQRSEQGVKSLRKSLLKSKIIIRNLSFKCTEDYLKKEFEKFGKVLEVKIPLKPDGKMRGFGFVLFKNVSEAGKALRAMNLKKIKGRQVAIDWALPKDKYIASQQSTSSENKSTKETKTDSESESQDDDGEEDEDEDNEDDEDDDNNEDSDKDSFDSSNDEEDSQDEEDEDLPVKKKTPKIPLSSDVKEGRTVFIRNLSFDTEEDGLEEILLQYGELNYIKICVHPDTEHSKGCAFAQFKTKEAAEKCIAAAQDEAENGGIVVDGRKLFIVAAVSREDALKMKVDKTKVETGSRNLYLAREGLIRPGSQAAEGVSEADMAKRARFEDAKRAKLRDINVFVSKKRLCIHNLPKSVDNKKLRALCLQGLKGVKSALITECRIMYDKKPVKGQTMGQSLGFGFVKLNDHEHALSTLRYLNNNPTIFGAQKRPIVEFSLEDSRKLKIKEIRQQKTKDFLKNRPEKGGFTLQKSGHSSGPQKPTNPIQTKGKQGISERRQQNKFYSGFHTNSEIEHVDLQNGRKRRKVLPMPSHRGPKIRIRDKGKQRAPPAKKFTPGTKHAEHQRRRIEKDMPSRNQKGKMARSFKRRDGDHFDSLVEQYKKKLINSSGKNPLIKRSKWFES